MQINKRGDYERIEFLGDAVLELVSSHYLYVKYPEKKEGELTKLRASMVCEPALAYCAQDIHLEKYLILEQDVPGGEIPIDTEIYSNDLYYINDIQNACKDTTLFLHFIVFSLISACH